MMEIKKRRRGTAIVETPKGILVTAVSGKTFILPGGGAKKEEIETEAAIRELKEETGINEISLNKKSFIEEYSFERDGFRFNKTVKYFLCFVYSMKSGTPDGFKKEIPELKWLRYEDAKQLITFPEAKGILDQTYQYLRS